MFDVETAIQSGLQQISMFTIEHFDSLTMTLTLPGNVQKDVRVNIQLRLNDLSPLRMISFHPFSGAPRLRVQKWSPWRFSLNSLSEQRFSARISRTAIQLRDIVHPAELEIVNEFTISAWFNVIKVFFRLFLK